jgi:uncharacterized membrane protein YgcG
MATTGAAFMPRAATAAAGPQHDQLITVATDPKFEGSGGPITAQEWIRAIRNTINVRNLRGRAAVNYAVAQLAGTAALKFDLDNGDAYDECPEAIDDWELWQPLYMRCYGRSTTPAEAVADWSLIRQGEKEMPGDMYTRVRVSVRAFFEAVNGSKPPQATARKDWPVGCFMLPREGIAAIDKFEADFKTEFRQALRETIDAQTLMDSDPQHRAALTREQKAVDNKAMGELEKVVFDKILHVFMPTIVNMTYGRIWENTSRAMILRTMQQGLRLQECRKEAFQHLKNTSLSMTEMCRTMNALQFNATNGLNGQLQLHTNGGRTRQRINAMGEVVWEEVPDEAVPSADSPATERTPAPTGTSMEQRMAAMESSINAIKTQSGRGRRGGRGGGRGGRGGGGGRPENPDKDKTCNWCTKKAHTEKNCWAKAAGKPKATGSEN